MGNVKHIIKQFENNITNNTMSDLGRDQTAGSSTDHMPKNLKRAKRGVATESETQTPKKAKENEIILQDNTTNSTKSTAIRPKWIPQPELHKSNNIKSTPVRRPH